VIAVHKKHVFKLEAALRCLDNDAIEADDLDPIRDGLDYYLVRPRGGGGQGGAGGRVRGTARQLRVLTLTRLPTHICFPHLYPDPKPTHHTPTQPRPLQSQEDSEHYDNVDDLYADIAETLEAVETVAGPGTLVSHGSKGGSVGGKDGGGRGGSKGGGDDESRERERERAAAAAAKAQLVAQGAITKSVDEEDARGRPGGRPPSVAPPGGGGGTPQPSPGVPPSPGGRGAVSALQLPAAARSGSDAGGTLGRQDSSSGQPASPQQPSASPVGGVLSPLAAAAAAAAGPGALRPGGPLSPQSAAAAAAAAGGAGAPSGGRLGAWMSGAPPAGGGGDDNAGGKGGTPGAAAAPAAGGGGQQQQAAAGKEEGSSGAAAGGATAPTSGGGAAAGGAGPAPPAGGDAPPPAAGDVAAAGAPPPGTAGPPPPPAAGAAGPLASADALAEGVAGLSLDSSASGAAAFEVLSRLAASDLNLGQLSTAPVGVGAPGGAPGGGGPPGPGPAPAALGVLDAAFRSALPQPVDSDWARSRPRHPVATPPTFPRVRRSGRGGGRGAAGPAARQPPCCAVHELPTSLSQTQKPHPHPHLPGRPRHHVGPRPVPPHGPRGAVLCLLLPARLVPAVPRGAGGGG
jgi:CCR4-NOT transcription complex subunit 3